MNLKTLLIGATCLCVSLLTGPSFAKPGQPGTVVDYDIVGFQCPPEAPGIGPVEVTVWVANQGGPDTGALLQIFEEDALLGPTLMAEETVYDEIDNGKQRSTAYTYSVTPTGYQTYVQWSAHLTDQNYTNDLDWSYCSTTLLW